MAKVEEVLDAMADGLPCNSRGLAERLNMAPRTVRGILTRLQTQGLIKKGCDLRDTRRVIYKAVI